MRAKILSPEEKLIAKKKYNARDTLRREIRKGRIKRLPCEVCGEPKSEAHHPDYSKPLEVRWLCTTHHKREHRKKDQNVCCQCNKEKSPEDFYISRSITRGRSYICKDCSKLVAKQRYLRNKESFNPTKSQ